MTDNIESTKETNYTPNETNMLKVMLETDWSGTPEGGHYEWFLGVMLGKIFDFDQSS